MPNKIKASRKWSRWTPEDEPTAPPPVGALFKVKSKLYAIDPPPEGESIPALIDVNSGLHSSIIPKSTLAMYVGSGRAIRPLHGKRALNAILHIFMINGKLYSIQRLREVVPLDAEEIPDEEDSQ